MVEYKSFGSGIGPKEPADAAQRMSTWAERGNGSRPEYGSTFGVNSNGSVMPKREVDDFLERGWDSVK